MKESMKEFGQFIKNMRESVKWTYEHLGENLNVHSKTIMRWENGKGLNSDTIDLYVLEVNLRDIVKDELRKQREGKVVL